MDNLHDQTAGASPALNPPVLLPTSFYTVRKHGKWWTVTLITSSKPDLLMTPLYGFTDRDTAVAYGKRTAAKMQRPFKREAKL